MRLEALFFDLDDTLCATTKFARSARRNAVRAMLAHGVKAPLERVLAELEEVISEFTSNYEHHFDKLLLRLEPEALAGVNRALVIAAAVAAYHDTKFRELKVVDGCLELMADLRSVGMRLGIISHGRTLKQAEKIVRLGLAPLLDPAAIFISDEVGINKPNPKLFQHALRASAVEPQRAMYVGDHPQNDIGPPKSIGMITVWAKTHARSELSSDRPDHVIANFGELRLLMREHYDVRV
jgi:putative hydrolase of the HAD superfamily